MVIQKILQLTMQRIAMRFASRSAVRSFASSALQPDFKILWKVSIFHLCAYTVRDEMKQALVLGLHRVQVRNKRGEFSTALPEIRYRRMVVRPPMDFSILSPA
jgi:hypothetical protein